MFGVIVAGRPVQTQLQQVGPAKFLSVIPQASLVNHLCVFMTGATLFPEGLAGGIYFAVPPFDQWQFLGVISNDKPSAMFRIGWKDVSTDTVQLGWYRLLIGRRVELTNPFSGRHFH
jgi:hypothetical protein